MAGTLGRIENFVIEDGEVESQSQPDGVRRRQVHKRDVLQQEHVVTIRTHQYDSASTPRHLGCRSQHALKKGSGR